MNIVKFTAILSLAAGLAAITPALAEESSLDESPGMSSLGIDISHAGGTSATVSQFLAGLSPEAQRGVINGCQNAAIPTNAGNYDQDVQSFCHVVNGLGGNVQALGFAAPEPRRVFPFSRRQPATSNGAY